jgi:hypothetical protein
MFGMLPLLFAEIAEIALAEIAKNRGVYRPDEAHVDLAELAESPAGPLSVTPAAGHVGAQEETDPTVVGVSRRGQEV